MSNPNHSELSGAPGTIVLRGQTLLVQKLTRQIVFTMYEWAERKVRSTWNPFAEVAEVIGGLSVSDEERAGLLRLALEAKLSGDVPAHLVVRALRSPDGVALYLQLTTGETAPIDDPVALYAALEEATGADLLGAGRLPSAYWIVAYCRDDPMEVKFYRDLVEQCGLTAAEIDTGFTLSQISAIFSAGYTKQQFNEMCDHNEKVLSGQNSR